MKLIYCPKCKDVVKLRVGHRRTCWCKASGGKYTDGLNAEIDGDAIPLGILNGSFYEALGKQPKKGPGPDFKAFVIEINCPTIRRVVRPKRLKAKPGPSDWQGQLDALTVNQRKMVYAICMEPTAHPHAAAYKATHELTSGGITTALKTLKALDLIAKASDHVWWVRDNNIKEWLHERLSSQTTDENDAAWSRYFEWQKAGIIKLATKEFGDKEKALAWLNSPCYSLCDHVPMEMLESPGGFEQLCQYLAWRNAS